MIDELKSIFINLRKWLDENGSLDFSVDAEGKFVWFKVEDIIITGLSPEKARELGKMLISEANKIQSVN
jgi:hypothetical protein